MSPRTLAIFFPDAEVQYWFTDRVFVVGEHLKRRRDGDSPPSEGPA
jgi:hypothetical protein